MGSLCTWCSKTGLSDFVYTSLAGRVLIFLYPVLGEFHAEHYKVNAGFFIF